MQIGLASARLLLGSVFLYAGFLKIFSPLEFADAIYTFDLVPSDFIQPLATILPPLEIILGSLLIFRYQVRAAALGILILSCVFTVAILQGIVRGLPIDCNCFGQVKWLNSNVWTALGRDLLLVIVAGFVYFKTAEISSL